MEILEIEEVRQKEKEAEIAEKKKSFLETIADSEEQKILAETLKRKEKIQAEGKKASVGIANLTKEMLQSEYVNIDGDVGLTFEEVLVARTLGDMMRKQNKSGKDLSDIQKVVEGNTSDVGVRIVFETNGQDLGD